jgi:hypothetical protein
MKVALSLQLALLAAVASFAPSVALACPLAADMEGADFSSHCSGCSSSMLSYVAFLLTGLAVGAASIAFQGDSAR